MATVIGGTRYWNGVERSYIPGDQLYIHPSVQLHSEEADHVDPITFEVIRHALQNINLEHGKTIEKLAVSPITLETRDFQTVILTEDADFVFFGPHLQYMSGMMDLMVKWTLENRSEDPGIFEGDMFLQNDPWVGTAHQPDVGLLCPVFVEGKIFCWVANAMHQADVGGTTPGSFCPDATDVFHDPPCFPPIKIVERGRVVRQVEDLYKRQSRLPVALSLDLRAGVAGNHVGKDRILELVERYGAAVVKAVMRRIIRASEVALVQRLELIPDGTWRERAYQEVAVTGDRGVYQWMMTLTKRGDQLIFRNEGTDPQKGSANLPFAGWRGAILGVLNVLMLPEQMGALGGFTAFLGGVARHCIFEPTPGTMTCPDFGAAVSPAGIYATELAIAMANALVAKMLSCSEGLHDYALTTGPAQWGSTLLAGLDQYGKPAIVTLTDQMIGTRGATPKTDGVAGDGSFWIPEGRGPNVEYYESIWPVLYLYRREHINSGGAGRTRGGNGGLVGYVPYDGSYLAVAVATAEGVPKTSGIAGGYPGSCNTSRILHNSSVRQTMAEGRVPQSFEELSGLLELCANKGLPIPVGLSDVVEWNWGSSAGFGDPILRDPTRVVEDVRKGIITEPFAQAVYGVALTRDGELDPVETKNRRSAIRQERLDRAAKPLVTSSRFYDRGDLRILGDQLVLVTEPNGDKFYGCNQCHAVLGPATGNVKELLSRWNAPIAQAGYYYGDPARFVDVPMEFREFYCPECAVLLANEVARQGDPVLQEFELD